MTCLNGNGEIVTVEQIESEEEIHEECNEECNEGEGVFNGGEDDDCYVGDIDHDWENDCYESDLDY
jgi:hypothetical protein